MTLNRSNSNKGEGEQKEPVRTSEIAVKDLQNGEPPEVIIQKVELQRSITFLGVIAILIANIGGTGIFIAPTTILRFSGSPGMSLIIWVLGGIFQALLAFCAVELALMFNKAGGPYYFIYHTFGDLAGFVFMWGMVIFILGPTWALGSLTASLYTLMLFYIDCEPPDVLVKLVAVWLIVTLMAINCTYTKVVTKIQTVLTSCKVIALVIIIVLGLIHVPTETGKENLDHFMEGTTLYFGNLSLAMLAGYFGFGGWQIITILAEEVKNPVKNVPRGLAVSFVLLILTMMAANFSYYTVLPKEEALKSDAVAILFGHRIHPALPVILSVLISLCSIGTLNVLIMGQPRLLFAAGRNGHMPRIMTMLHTKYNTPWPATWTLGIVATIMISTGSLVSLISAISLFAACMTFTLIMCLFYLRWKQPNLHRPFKIPLAVPIVVSLVALVITMTAIITNPSGLLYIVLITLLALPVYVLCIKCKAFTKHFVFMDRVGNILQQLFLLQYETKNTDH